MDLLEASRTTGIGESLNSRWPSPARRPETMNDIRYITTIAYDDDFARVNLELWGDPAADCWHLVQYDADNCQTMSFLDQDSPAGSGQWFCAGSDADAVRYVSVGRSWRRLSRILRGTVPESVWPRFDEHLHTGVRLAVLASRRKARESAATRKDAVQSLKS